LECRLSSWRISYNSLGALDPQQYPPTPGPLQYLGEAASRFIERHLSRGHQLQDQQPFLGARH
jgi:hypothetical protein